jgi:hypothetical protein
MASRTSRCICAEGASMSACYGGMVQVAGTSVGVGWLGEVHGARALASLGELMTQPPASTILTLLCAFDLIAMCITLLCASIYESETGSLCAERDCSAPCALYLPYAAKHPRRTPKSSPCRQN